MGPERLLGRLMMGFALVLMLILVGCGGESESDEAGTETTAALEAGETEATAAGTETEAEPVKIGVLNPTTGAQTQNGTDVNTGVKLYFDSIGNEVAGRQVELIFEDDASNPQQGLERARKLVENDEVDLLMGVVHSGVGVGVAEYAAQQQVPYIVTCAGANAITGPDSSPYVFRTAETNGQRNLVIGWYTGAELGKKKAAVFSWDFIAGKEHADAFTESFEATGGEVVYNIATPLPTQDFGPFLSQVDKSKIDVIYAFFASADAIRFVQQLREFGFTPEVQVVEQGSLTEDEILPEQGESAVGVIGTTCYTASLDNPVNAKFKELYAEVADREPGWYVYQGYVGAQVAAAAIEAVGGNLTDTQAFLDAIASVKVEGPGGPLMFDDRGQAILNQYVVQVKKGSDGYYHEVMDEMPAVDQDWQPPSQ
ncbi:MAG: ABC transporter substrate-binding protein [Thermoleophilia bacterium]